MNGGAVPRLCRKGQQIRWRAAAVLGHGRADREPPDRRVLGLRQPLRPGADRPHLAPAGSLGRGRWPPCRGRYPRTGGDDVLPDPGARRGRARRPGAGRRHALGDRGLLRGGQGRGRVGSVRGTFVAGMASARHVGHAGAGLPCRGRQGGGRGERSGSTRPKRCCPSPCRKSDGCLGSSSGHPDPSRPRRSPGRAGADATRNVPNAATGNDEPTVWPGCSIKPDGRSDPPFGRGLGGGSSGAISAPSASATSGLAMPGQPAPRPAVPRAARRSWLFRPMNRTLGVA